ncbi:GDP-mannose 4,6-dehydratase [Planktomarina temperata]|nr:GDP-mannose 4,6-dehydratase [Planktomarina temperata]
MISKALIFGTTGQDGSYLSELLLEKNIEVHGTKRRSSSINTMRVDHLLKRRDFHLHHADITDTASVFSLVNRTKPDVIFNLAAQSHVGVSFNEPEYTGQVDAIGTLRVLEAIKELDDNIIYYQASTSELFGGLSEEPLNELTPLNPRSPYAAAKLYAYYLTKQYREGYGLRCYNGILFNHESPRRGENFVTRKITTELSKLVRGETRSFSLGNLDAKRDWGHARDYVAAMMTMVLTCPPDDYVVATGEAHSIRDFLRAAFEVIGVEIEFHGKELNEHAVVVTIADENMSGQLQVGQKVLSIDAKYYRPLEVPHLLGDASKFMAASGWSPKISFNELVTEMVHADV